MAVARSFGSAVLLVHVVPELSSPLSGCARGWGRPNGPVSRTRRRVLLRSRAGCGGTAEIETRVLFGRRTREIARLAATERAGLVIMTLRTPRDWFGPRRGSMSFEVLSQVTTPVLALPG